MKYNKNPTRLVDVYTAIKTQLVLSNYFSFINKPSPKTTKFKLLIKKKQNQHLFLNLSPIFESRVQK